ncbi:hypothetical protein PFICI_03449 [Pestalotiopsis fici W106-1]|uniref:Gylcosyl hydrolase 115 C-terminal domain-containing protein n=1 Tax=Pestalotiopsis fici (strain W106-1 / CGMCC3.15140) TaxID=1229662 RepID=W3XHF4_PESFW|nr:uncharacterized protein PFICI_03449 [Pestalotiopsis fici W106-1]ETS85424.1 hypothetical protein PFICI_03449 [Pestalotiopsis fici W106-1]
MFDTQLVAYDVPPGQEQGGEFSLKGAPIVVDKHDFVGVCIAARNLASDFGRVTGGDASTVLEHQIDSSWSHGETAIVVGSLSSSQIIRSLVESGQLQVDQLQGKWECFQTCVIENPACLFGCRKALVIAGSDKRGAIFGIYSLSEQIGVSPWYWWADVPPKHHANIYALPIHHISKEPSVKFRGIFINDEAPALTGWVLEKFGQYGKGFYERVFELLLRLKANFLWPAMWPGYPNPGSSFFVDDAQNQKLADDHGIVMSTSHHEPMQRATNEWFENNPDGSWSWIDNKDKITQFFRDGIERAQGCESYFTMGMRGEYDRAMKTDDPASVVQDVIQTQRRLIKERHGREDAVPQLLALYKEVQEYWDTGKLNVPDDVTLLFSDDNFGAIRRLPSGSETQRKGGAGIYYHFEYVGVPRSYKWINSNSLGKVWQQLQEAHRRNAKQIWVFNVGDIKPMEIPLSFAMQLAWDIDSISAISLPDFLLNLARQMFGGTIDKDVASAWLTYDRLMALRRHEHIEADTFSLLHYEEADTVLGKWDKLLADSQKLYDTEVHKDYQAAFFDLVLHPIKASAIYTSLRINLARNQLWAEQRRNSANTAARKVLDLFDADFRLSEEFHSLLDGKWNNMMRQTHYGYKDTWHAPSRDMISGICFVQARQDSNPLIGQLGIAIQDHPGVRPGRCNEESDRTHPSRRDLVPGVTLGAMTPYGPSSRWFTIFTRGSMALSWECSCPHEWVRLSKKAGRLVPGQDDEQVYISIDWDKVPACFHEEILIDVRSIGGNYGPYGDDFEQIHLLIINREVEGPFTGHVEADGHVSVPASKATSIAGYRTLPFLGRTDQGSVSVEPGRTDPPFLVYTVYTFQDVAEAHVELRFNMTLDIDPSDKMTFDVQIDDGGVETYRLVTDPERKGELPPGWYHAVQDCTWTHRQSIGNFKHGSHNIRLRFRHSNILLESLTVDLGGVKPSYLGPPASSFVN